MTDVDKNVVLPAPTMALINQHFNTLQRATMPISIREQVQVLEGNLGNVPVAREDLIQAVERCAVERGFSLHFDAHLGDDPDIAA